MYGIRDLARDRVTRWDGVRNYQARNFLRAMRKGDPAFFYHSGPRPEIPGEMTIARPAYPDPTQFDRRSPYYDPASHRDAPRWVCVDVRFAGRYAVPVGREALKRRPSLARMWVLRRPRLSVTPVTGAEWKAIRTLASPAGR